MPSSEFLIFRWIELPAFTGGEIILRNRRHARSDPVVSHVRRRSQVPGTPVIDIQGGFPGSIIGPMQSDYPAQINDVLLGEKFLIIPIYP